MNDDAVGREIVSDKVQCPRNCQQGYKVYHFDFAENSEGDLAPIHVCDKCKTAFIVEKVRLVRCKEVDVKSS